jgi:hypothetical protein
MLCSLLDGKKLRRKQQAKVSGILSPKFRKNCVAELEPVSWACRRVIATKLRVAGVDFRAQYCVQKDRVELARRREAGQDGVLQRLRNERTVLQERLRASDLSNRQLSDAFQSVVALVANRTADLRAVASIAARAAASAQPRTVIDGGGGPLGSAPSSPRLRSTDPWAPAFRTSRPAHRPSLPRRRRQRQPPGAPWRARRRPLSA